jgi:hypothetical protein
MQNGIFFFFLVGFTVAIAGAIAQMDVLPSSQSSSVASPDAVKPACTTYDPPNKTDTVFFEGITYDLLNEKAGISLSKVKAEMKKIGNVSGKDIYQDTGANYFGQEIGSDFIYVDLTTKDSHGMLLFNIYIKDGVAIPDFVKNCKSVGGKKQTINYWSDSDFPPVAFNAADVKGTTVLTDPGYIYNNIKTTYAAVNELKGVVPTGSLYIPTKNNSYKLFFHLGYVYLINGSDAYEYLPTQEKVALSSVSKNKLQLQWFNIVDTALVSWYTPACKPAVYLYPTVLHQHTAVRIDAQGNLTNTIPQYPIGGWHVIADPDGTISYDGKIYPYLYYEAQILDAAIIKPKEGYVIPYLDLATFYSTLLPQLGLSPKEYSEFKDYWEQHLPYAPYYFVGIMPIETVNDLETLTISPKPDMVIRVRLYFEALQNWKVVEAPELTAVPSRRGFTVVDWGGMVKLHPGSNFTCVQ